MDLNDLLITVYKDYQNMQYYDTVPSAAILYSIVTNQYQ